MKRTIFCVALTLCAAMLAGCAVQASDRVQSPISAQTEVPQMRKADDAAEVVTALLPQMEDERSKAEGSADAPLPVERANASENADKVAEKQPTAVETAPPTAPEERRHPRLRRRINLLLRLHLHLPRQRNRGNNLRLCPNLSLRLSPPPAGTSTPSRRLSRRATSTQERSTA